VYDYTTVEALLHKATYREQVETGHIRTMKIMKGEKSFFLCPKHHPQETKPQRYP
jgi:hypothetical protein